MGGSGDLSGRIPWVVARTGAVGGWQVFFGEPGALHDDLLDQNDLTLADDVLALGILAPNGYPITLKSLDGEDYEGEVREEWEQSGLGGDEIRTWSRVGSESEWGLLSDGGELPTYKWLAGPDGRLHVWATDSLDGKPIHSEVWNREYPGEDFSAFLFEEPYGHAGDASRDHVRDLETPSPYEDEVLDRIRQMEGRTAAAESRWGYEDGPDYRMQYAEMVPIEAIEPYMEFDRRDEPVWQADQDYIGELRDDIARRGIMFPVFLDYDPERGVGHVSEGHHRIELAKDLGMPGVPVLVYPSTRRGRRERPLGPFTGEYLNQDKMDKYGEHPRLPDYIPPSQLGLPTIGAARTAASDLMSESLDNWYGPGQSTRFQGLGVPGEAPGMPRIFDPQAPQTEPCPHCGRPDVPIYVTVCPSCGMRIRPGLEIASATEVTAGPSAWWEPRDEGDIPPDPATARAFVYVPESDQLYMGDVGSVHEDVWGDAGRPRDVVWGRLDEDTGDTYLYNGLEHSPAVERAVEGWMRRLGASEQDNWAYLDGQVAFGGQHWDLVGQLARDLGLGDEEAQRLSNLVARGHLPPDLDIAIGSTAVRRGRRYPQIWLSTVDRNAVWGAVADLLRGRTAAWGLEDGLANPQEGHRVPFWVRPDGTVWMGEPGSNHPPEAEGGRSVLGEVDIASRPPGVQFYNLDPHSERARELTGVLRGMATGRHQSGRLWAPLAHGHSGYIPASKGRREARGGQGRPEPTVSWMTGRGTDEGDPGFWGQRRAWIYLPERDELFLGVEGSHHWDLADEFGLPESVDDYLDGEYVNEPVVYGAVSPTPSGDGWLTAAIFSIYDGSYMDGEGNTLMNYADEERLKGEYLPPVKAAVSRALGAEFADEPAAPGWDLLVTSARDGAPGSHAWVYDPAEDRLRMGYYHSQILRDMGLDWNVAARLLFGTLGSSGRAVIYDRGVSFADPAFQRYEDRVLALLAAEHGGPVQLIDGGSATWKLGAAPPLPPGETPLPDGYVRLFHYTSAPADVIRREGLRLDRAKGENYGEPNRVWATTQFPTGALEGGRNVVEFAVPIGDSRWDIGRYQDGTNYGWPNGKAYGPEAYRDYLAGRDVSVTFFDSIGPGEILAVHEPWHDRYRYFQDEGLDPGDYGFLDDEERHPDYARAFQELRAPSP